MGEFEKRIEKLNDYDFGASKVIDVLDIVKEAKKEFPWNKDEMGQYDNTVGDIVVLDWFVKWFGDK